MIKSLKARDHIFVNIAAQDLWLKVFLTMEAPNEKAFESEFEIKIDIGLNGRELKSVLQKLSISIWNRLCRENQNSTLLIPQGQDGFHRGN